LAGINPKTKSPEEKMKKLVLLTGIAMLSMATAVFAGESCCKSGAAAEAKCACQAKDCTADKCADCAAACEKKAAELEKAGKKDQAEKMKACGAACKKVGEAIKGGNADAIAKAKEECAKAHKACDAACKGDAPAKK
jgi:hypothetical protein